MSIPLKIQSLDYILSRLKTVYQMSNQFHNILVFQSQPLNQSIIRLQQNLQLLNNKLGQIGTQIQSFQNNVFFVNTKQQVIEEPIRSERLGLYEHSIKEQIQTSQEKQPEQNIDLGQKMLRINQVIDKTIDYLIEKL